MKPVLVKKALPRHWSKDFDTVEEAMREAQAARMASKQELGNIEDIPIAPGTLEWEMGLTRDGKARSLIPGVSRGRVLDQGLVDQGGAFAYPALRQSFFPSLHPEVMGRRAGIPLGDDNERDNQNMMMFTTEKPRLHATQKEGREQTEAFYPGGFDPAQTYLLSDPTKTFRRLDLEEANRAFMGRNESNFAEGTEGADTPVGRIVAPMSSLVSNKQNPLTVQPWGRPQTVEDVFQLSEPMDIAFQLLKQNLELQPPMTQGVQEEQPIEEETPMIDVSMDNYESPCECAEKVRNEVIQAIQHSKDTRSGFELSPQEIIEYDEHILNTFGRIEDWQTMSCEEILQWAESSPYPHYQMIIEECQSGMNESDQMKYTGEPMDIALQLLKERVSPEAKRHKLEYDKKYESSPERVKYREELNRERRRRGIYGSHDHKDISHTEGGKLTLEGEHENRARHFKDKGTLREL